MKIVQKYIQPYRIEAILAPLFKLMEALMDLFFPLIVAWVINQGIRGEAPPKIWFGFFCMVMLAIVGFVFSVTAQWFAAKAAVGFGTGLRQGVFDHIQTLSYTELDQVGVDTLLTRITSDINQTQTGVNIALRLLLRSPLIVIGSMVMAFTINAQMALIFLVSILVLGGLVYLMIRISIPLYSQAQKILDGLLGKTRENIDGVRVIRAFHKEEEEIEVFERQNQKLTSMNEYVGKIVSLMTPGTYFLINLATIILIQQGAWRMEEGALTQGGVVALYNYMGQMIIELVKLVTLMNTLNKSLACAKRVEDVMELESSMNFLTNENETDSMSHSKPIIEFCGVDFSYLDADAPAIEGVSLTIEKGQTVGVIGATGSGKSTLVQLVPRFYDATQGRVLIQGQDVRTISKEKLRKKIGVVPQQSVLFEGTIRENLQLGNECATDEELWQALEIAQAKEFVQAKEGQLDAKIEQNGKNLSGGQKQRLAIARALALQPEILILDDSASALDFATDYQLRRSLAQLDEQMTVLIVSQRAASIKQADLILVFEDGQIVGQGSHEELLETCTTYQEIYDSQFPNERLRKGGVEHGS